MNCAKVVIIGAGVGGLVAALLLAARGQDVVVVESEGGPGGKLRALDVDGAPIDAGPTVFTMREAFDDILYEAGADWSDRLTLRPLARLARHAWGEAQLDLFTDIDRSADAVGDFAGKREAENFRRFSARAAQIYETLKDTFIRASRPTPLSLTRRAGIAGLPGLVRISPFTTLWSELGRYFQDPRLRQLFARYATYCGSSPFAAPATLALVAHVEREGVFTIDGGMSRLGAVLADLAKERGARFFYHRRVERIVVERGRVAGVLLDRDERIDADAVVMNGDVAALRDALLGAQAAQAVGAARGENSLSALTWLAKVEPRGFPLAHHNVFFSNAYRAEFDDIFVSRRLPREPTIYVCAQDRGEEADAPSGPERLLCLVNAPAAGTSGLTQEEFRSCEKTMIAMLARCGLQLALPATTVRRGPAEFARLFPATQGALYGQASHGWTASFTRPQTRTKLPGLYLAGGSTHPGPGVPMAALSGRLAAHALTADLASTRPLRRALTPGGMSTA